MSFLGQPLIGTETRFPYGVTKNPVVAPGATDALPVADAIVMVTRAGVNAMTLGTPVPGVYPAGSTLMQALGDPQDDGNILLVVSTTAQAHTITTAANKINGNRAVATFAAAVGNWIRLIAFNGIWYVIGSAGITLT